MSVAQGGRSLTRLLKALQRPRAHAEVELSGDVISCVRVKGGSGVEPDVIHHASIEAWNKAVREGLVAETGADGRWRLSAAGRQRLAEFKSRSNEPDQKPWMQPESDRAANTAADERSHRRRAAAQDMAGCGSGARPAENGNESPLSWLHRRRDRNGAPMISDRQFHAGERLRADYEQGQLMPRLTIDWQRLGNAGECSGRRGADAMEISERALAARERVNRALMSVGPELGGMLVDVCCHLKGLEQLERAAGWPQRSAKIVLQVALSALARHYGLDGGGSEERRPMRHWGADGYRPDITMQSGEGERP